MPRKSKPELIEIYKDTLNYAKDMIKEPPMSFKSKMNDKEIEELRVNCSKLYEKTNIWVENSDVIESIIKLNKISPSTPENKMLVLNLASHKCFGGGVRSGAMAQEEELFRKTDYGNHYGKELYPLEKDEFVVTPCVTVIKDTNYKRLKGNKFVRFDGFAIAGVCHPTLVDGHLNKKDYELTKKKIETIFKFAVFNENKNLILGALGCGVFFNPPEDIVEIYNYCLEKYYGYFENIVFSVLSINNDNYDIFNNNIQKNFIN